MSGQLLDPGPLQDGCDPKTCTDRAGGEHSDECVTEEMLANAAIPGFRFDPSTGSYRSLADQVRDRQVEIGLGPDLFADWTEAEMRETFGR